MVAPRAAKTPERTAALWPAELLVADMADAAVALGNPLGQHLAGVVGRAVVDDQHLIVLAGKRSVDLAEQEGEVLGFVAAGNDDRDGRLAGFWHLARISQNRGLISIDRWPMPPRRFVPKIQRRSRMSVRDLVGVIASGSSLTSTIAGLPLARARSNAGAKSAVRSTVSPWPP